jgi:hypothetical protein
VPNQTTIRRRVPTPIAEPKRLERLLYSRAQASELLGGASTTLLKRLEKQGALTPIKLSRRRQSQVYYSHDNLMQVAAGRT